MQYYYDGKVEAFDRNPHGNCTRSSSAYTRKFESTKQFIEDHGKKESLALFDSQNKDFANISHVDQAISGKMQVYKRCPTKKADDVEAVLLQCREQWKTPEIRFIREATLATTLAVFLASDRQLNDFMRFCVLGIDTTYNCGKILVTVLTYRHLLLESDTAKIGKLLQVLS